jgi:hypothetical protein
MQEPPPVPLLLDRLAAFAADIEAQAPLVSDWRWRPAPEQWSLTEVFCHLRDVEQEIHQSRFRALLAAENAFLPGVAADEWAVTRGYQDQDGAQALADFVRARRETVAMLNGVDERYWRRHGRHSFFGPTSSHELLALVVDHDHAHWEQITALIQLQT